MFESDVTLFLAFLAGILSFLSPCVLPILPSFLGYMTGISLESFGQKKLDSKIHRRLVWNALLFSLGFSMVFLLVGAAVGSFGEIFIKNQILFQRIGGVLIMILGLHLMGIIKFSALLKERSVKVPQFIESMGRFRSFFVGILFSFGWAPCYGPITGAILTLVATKGSVVSGLWLFGWYTFGFILPFLLISLFIGQSLQLIRKWKSVFKYLNFISGLIVFVLGFLLLGNWLSLIVNDLYSYYTNWDLWILN
jgi:cytochrome c-type biogenesis protein